MHRPSCAAAHVLASPTAPPGLQGGSAAKPRPATTGGSRQMGAGPLRVEHYGTGPQEIVGGAGGPYLVPGAFLRGAASGVYECVRVCACVRVCVCVRMRACVHACTLAPAIVGGQHREVPCAQCTRSTSACAPASPSGIMVPATCGLALGGTWSMPVQHLSIRITSNTSHGSHTEQLPCCWD